MRRIIFLFIVAVSAACVSSCSLKKVVLPGTGDSQDTLQDLANKEPIPDAYPVAISMGPIHVYRDPLTGLPIVAKSKVGSPPARLKLVIPGTGDSQDILRELAAVYEQSHPNIDIVIPDSTGSFATQAGTLGGLESAGTRTTELGRTAVRPREVDLKKFGPMYYREFARGPVAFVVHKSVPLKEVTSQELCAIYAGHITNWKELDGPNLPLVVQTRPEGSNMLAIRKAIACFKDLQVTDKGHFNLHNADTVASLHNMEGAIGFMPLSEAQHHGFTVLNLEGQEPIADAYPVTVSLGLVHMDPLTGPAKDFADFLATDKAAKILRQSGHIPVAAKSQLVSCHQRDLRVSRCPASATVTPSPS